MTPLDGARGVLVHMMVFFLCSRRYVLSTEYRIVWIRASCTHKWKPKQATTQRNEYLLKYQKSLELMYLFNPQKPHKTLWLFE